jgi:Mrp family chromosome partitioning ATPase
MNIKNIKGETISNHHLQSTENNETNRQKIKKMREERLFTTSELDDLKIIHAGSKDYKTLNEYRELRTRLLKISQNKNFVCMISSINIGAEAAHIAINLAASIALDDNKTALIIDCNTHDLGLSNYLKTPTTFGLTNFLAQDTDDIEAIIYQSGIPRIRMIPVGIRTEYAAEYFSSEKMTLFLEGIKKRYPDRFIILNTPPIELYAESQILASLCDLSILVIRYGQANKVRIQTSIDIIGHDKFAGLIFYK